jgi:MFS superfamily sulfate permease-like transporter
MTSSKLHPLKNWQYDFPAAVVVFLVALPLCLGVALASGVPLFSGIIAGVVGGVLIGLLSKSPLSVSGPAAGLTVLVLAAVKQLPTFEAFLLATFLAGAFQLFLGSIRAGLIGDFIPSSVIKGMLTAIGLILILKQIPHAVGFDKDYEGDFYFDQKDGENTFTALFHALDAQFTPGAILIALISLIFLFSWESLTKRPVMQRFKSVPGPLIVVLMGIGLNEIFKIGAPFLAITPEHLVNILVPESAAQFFGQFRFLNFQEINNPLVWTSALTLGAVASIETLLSIEAVDRLDPFKRVTPTNRELMAQGIGNMVSGLIGGMPVTSVIVRSSANVSSGGRTQTATILHGLFLLFSAALIPTLLNKIPLSALAAVLIATGYKLTKPAVFIGEYKRGYAHLIPFVVTVAAILFTDLLKGVFIGVAVAAISILWENYKSTVKVAVDENGTYLVKISKDLSFIHKAELKRTLSEIPDGAEVWLNISKIGFVDLDNAEIIRDFIESGQYRNLSVNLVPPENPKVRQHILNEPQ